MWDIKMYPLAIGYVQGTATIFKPKHFNALECDHLPHVISLLECMCLIHVVCVVALEDHCCLMPLFFF